MTFSNQVFKNSETGQLFDVFTTPTTDLIPALDSTYDLGSTTKKWDDAYINKIHTQSISVSNVFEGLIDLTGYGANKFYQIGFKFVRLGDIAMVSIDQGNGPDSVTTTTSVIATAAEAIPVIYRPLYDISQTFSGIYQNSRVVFNFTYKVNGQMTVEYNFVSGQTFNLDKNFSLIFPVDV